MRIRAGERILQLEHYLEERNNKLAEAYEIIRTDIDATAKLQKSLLPGSSAMIFDLKFQSIFHPSSFLEGDIFNFFMLDEHHVGFYLLDVAGHGIPFAMLSFTISKTLSPNLYNSSLWKQENPDDPCTSQIGSPRLIIDELNKLYQQKDDAMQYFTMV